MHDFSRPDERIIAAKGGRGGRGNQHFATSTHQAPRESEAGREGEERAYRLELKLLADVGLVGYPNAGKSTLISRISAAKPKIADYPFTTLEPNLGVVSVGEPPHEDSYVVADIPGLIEGAHLGAGLGVQFLRHIERTRVLVHLVDVSDASGRPDPVEDFRVIMAELKSFGHGLEEKPMLVVASKADVANPDKLKKLRAMAKRRKLPFFAISAVTGAGIKELKYALGDLVRASREAEIAPADTSAATDTGLKTTSLKQIRRVIRLASLSGCGHGNQAALGGGELDQLPGGSIAQQAGDQRGVHSVASALSHDPAEDAMSGQGKIADQVEHFMTDELVVKAKRPVLHRAPAKDDRVLLRRAPDQSHIPQHFFIFAKPKGAGGGNLGAVGSSGQIDGKRLAADGMGKIDVVSDAVSFAGINGDELAVLTDFNTFQYAQILAPAPLAPDAYLGKGFHVRQGAAIEDWQFQVIELDNDVVDAHADQRGKEMLGGGYEHPLAHDAGGVADLGYVSARRRNFVIVQVGAAENNARSGRGGQQAHVHRRPAVETDSRELDHRRDGLF